MKILSLGWLFIVQICWAGAVPTVSAPVWLIPPSDSGPTSGLSQRLGVGHSNNNVAMAYFSNRLFVAFRSADHHQPRPPSMGDFATRTKVDLAMRYLGVPGGFSPFLGPIPKSPRTRMFLLSAPVSKRELRSLESVRIEALPWNLEATLDEPDMDLREPMFAVVGDKLLFYYVSIEGKALKFNPVQTWVITRNAQGAWGERVAAFAPKELLWEVKRSGDELLATSYSGGHYETGDDQVTQVFLRRSTDGVHWKGESVYQGGVSEAAIELDSTGNLWSVMRLDDGDPEKGWGSLVGFGTQGNLARWELPSRADPRRFDSPRLFRVGEEIYLIARQNISGDEKRNAPYDLLFLREEEKRAGELREDLLRQLKSGRESNKSPSMFSLALHLVGLGRWAGVRYPLGVFYEYDFSYWAKYPKRTALYHLNRQERKLDYVLTLPSAGDTAFPSILELGEGDFLVVNYSSPFEKSDWSWGTGQKNATGIYFVKISFPRVQNASLKLR